jgi:hypothetical protein
MADFNRKKLQIFVSSTFSDLVEERQAAVEAILSGGHIPAGMELFTAGDESQMEAIKQWIDESDVYLLILGGRYGSIEPKTGKSYTQLEYEYALSHGKPLFACVIRGEAIEPRVKKEGTSVIEMENPKKLREFRDLALSKMSEFWEDSKDIKIIISRKLSQLTRRENLIGWVRPSTQSNFPARIDENARLSTASASAPKRLDHTKRNSPATQYTKTVPKNPADADATLESVLEVVIFQTKDGDELISYQIKPDKVVLTFEGLV